MRARSRVHDNRRSSARQSGVSFRNTSSAARTPSALDLLGQAFEHLDIEQRHDIGDRHLGRRRDRQCADARPAAPRRLRGRASSGCPASSMREFLDQHLLAHRLRYELVHSGVAAGLDVVGERVRRQCDHRNARPIAAERADRARGFEPVHFGHPHVHEHDVEGAVGGLLDRLAAVLRDRHRDIEVLHQLGEDQLVGRVVLGEEDAQRLGRVGQHRGEIVLVDGAAGAAEIGFVGDRQRQGEA